MKLTLRFRNNDFSLFKLDQIEGAPNFPPLYTEPQPTDNLQAAKAAPSKIQIRNKRHLPPKHDHLVSFSKAQTRPSRFWEILNFRISNLDGRSEITLQYTANGVDFVGKTLENNNSRVIS